MKSPGTVPGLFHGCNQLTTSASPNPYARFSKRGYLKICSIMILEGMNNVFV